MPGQSIPKLAIASLVSEHTTVFRACEAILRADPTFSSVCNGRQFRTWSGLSDDSVDPTVSMAPFLRLTPIPGPEAWWSPGSAISPLLIHVEMLIAGLCYDDVFNFYRCVTRAFYPPNNSNAIIQQLRAAGAKTGLALFTQPSYDPTPKDMYFHAFGQMRVDVQVNLQP